MVEVMGITRNAPTKRSPEAKLADAVARYEGGRIFKEHSLHLNRCFRAIDGLRKFKDLPPQPTAVANALMETRAQHLAHHRIAGKIF
jgi:hypothetical protein